MPEIKQNFDNSTQLFLKIPYHGKTRRLHFLFYKWSEITNKNLNNLNKSTLSKTKQTNKKTKQKKYKEKKGKEKYGTVYKLTSHILVPK